jgi:membrane protein implicated in regulation of membrane protease activity
VNMTGMIFQLTAMDFIVGLALLFALVFVAAWLISPRLREWVERPKYRFQADVRAYDQVQKGRSIPS